MSLLGFPMPPASVGPADGAAYWRGKMLYRASFLLLSFVVFKNGADSRFWPDILIGMIAMWWHLVRLAQYIALWIVARRAVAALGAGPGATGAVGPAILLDKAEQGDVAPR